MLRIGARRSQRQGHTSPAAKRVDPLRAQTGLARDQVIDRFIQTFTTLYGATEGHISDEEYAEAEALVETKFATDAWLQRVP